MLEIGKKFICLNAGCVYTITSIIDNNVVCSIKNALGREMIIFEMDKDNFENLCEEGLITLL